MLFIVDRLPAVHREILPNISMMVPDRKKSRRIRGTTALISISPFLARCITFTYRYVNTGEFYNAANPLLQADAAHICTLLK
jgi:hypothetical protein